MRELPASRVKRHQYKPAIPGQQDKTHEQSVPWRLLLLDWCAHALPEQSGVMAREPKGHRKSAHDKLAQKKPRLRPVERSRGHKKQHADERDPEDRRNGISRTHRRTPERSSSASRFRNAESNL